MTPSVAPGPDNRSGAASVPRSGAAETASGQDPRSAPGQVGPQLPPSAARATGPSLAVRIGSASGPPAGVQASFYDIVGGHETFVRLVAVFYAEVATDPLLRPLYPEEDLAPAEERLRMFLEQYWGGPTTYSEQRGHPRLRMRHARFKVNPAARDAWLRHMRRAVNTLVVEGTLTPPAEAVLWDYLERAAHSMVNTFED